MRTGCPWRSAIWAYAGRINSCSRWAWTWTYRTVTGSHRTTMRGCDAGAPRGPRGVQGRGTGPTVGGVEPHQPRESALHGGAGRSGGVGQVVDFVEDRRADRSYVRCRPRDVRPPRVHDATHGMEGRGRDARQDDR